MNAALTGLMFPISAENRTRAPLRQVLGDLGEIRGALAGVGDYSRRAGRAMRNVGAGLTAGITAPIVGSIALMDRSINQLGLLQSQAASAGVSAEELTILGIATREFGIEQDKVADILRDVNDRIGDFSATGAGPMADFFENIAPMVGLTIESFEGLNSSDALALYVRSLEDANVSQAEMTFYMEALASDASMLLPLFRDNAAALDDMREVAERLGLSIDDDLIAGAADARREWTAMRAILGLEFQQALIQFAPILMDIGRGLSSWIEPLREGVSWFRSLSDETQAAVTRFGLIAAAAGPLLGGGGLMVLGVTAVSGAFATLASVLMAQRARLCARPRGF